MPLVFKNDVANNSKLAVWKKEEPVEKLELVFELNNDEKTDYSKISNEKRKQEWLITRILLTELLEKKVTINHNKNGRPYIKNSSLKVSISHSNNFVAIIASKTHNPGIDIEHISERVFKIKHKFLSTSELAQNTNNKQLTAIWAIKEAIFKIYETSLEFKNILVDCINIDDHKGILKAKVTAHETEKHFTLNYMIIEDDILVYTFDS